MPCEERTTGRPSLRSSLARYLSAKNKRTFSTAAEQDMVSDLIRDYWQTLGASGALVGRTPCQKLELFRGVRIVFPTVLVDQPMVNAPVISIDFRSSRRVGLADRCSCGSGLPFILCCGRIQGTRRAAEWEFLSH